MQISVNKTIKIGIIGGIIGGVIFGIIMQMMGKIAMIAGIMGSSSLLSGWIIHMMISIIFGITFGLLTSVIKNRLVLTIVFGVGIWIVGPLVIMPIMMGMGTNLLNAFAPQQLMTLGTHLFFSIIVAIAFKICSKNKHLKR
ncbi:hypothetical protein PDN08_05870 [Bacillus cereus]|uniref:hypothetical protein n=1 Tax=Bacillus cereus TaxID=1396 RepID=UPI00111F96AB|nr:hypothetical protein [Bacillus cereus]MDA2187247.1 hypothetical protein [Bacillus cereus]MDA2204942.1 hypothetical protein [Bacillus cereus]MDA2752840.1 hypothetical protein [Bacillus cereus]UDW00889.1 DUF1440 domain-containing protein [Bacillus cereus]